MPCEALSAGRVPTSACSVQEITQSTCNRVALTDLWDAAFDRARGSTLIWTNFDLIVAPEFYTEIAANLADPSSRVGIDRLVGYSSLRLDMIIPRDRFVHTSFSQVFTQRAHTSTHTHTFVRARTSKNTCSPSRWRCVHTCPRAHTPHIDRLWLHFRQVEFSSSCVHHGCTHASFHTKCATTTRYSTLVGWTVADFFAWNETRPQVRQR